MQTMQENDFLAFSKYNFAKYYGVLASLVLKHFIVC